MTRRIALVTHDLSQGGGVAVVTRFLYRVLAESGRYAPEVVSVATSSADPVSVRLLAPASWIRGPRIASRQWRGLLHRHVGAWWTELEPQRYRPRAALTELLRSFDLIQVVGGTPAWSCVAAGCDRPVALFTATTIRLERGARLARQRGLRRAWLRLMTQLNESAEIEALRRADCVFAESVSTMERLERTVSSQRLCLGRPGIDTEFFRPDGEERAGYILSVGRFTDLRKNARLLVDAYARICRAVPEVPDLVIVGAPPPHETMAHAAELGIAPRIRIHQNVCDEELATLYRGAGLFVLSSDEEGLGLVILEAMASGLPVVSTDCGGPATAVVEAETGFLTPVGDAESMAAAIQRLLVDPALRRRMGRAGRRIAETRFSLAATGQVFLDKYDEILDQAQRMTGMPWSPSTASSGTLASSRPL